MDFKQTNKKIFLLNELVDKINNLFIISDIKNINSENIFEYENKIFSYFFRLEGFINEYRRKIS